MEEENDAPNPLEQLLGELAKENHRNHARLIALIHLLIDRGILKGTDDEILKQIDMRAADIEHEEKHEAAINARVRAIHEAWSKIPKQ